MPTNINFNKKLGITGNSGITLPTSSTPPFSNTKSILLDGVDDFVNIGTTSLGITNAISISAWVKIPTTNTGGGNSNIQEIICEDATSGSNRNWALNWRGGANNNWQWVIWNTNGSVTVVTSTGLTPNDNQWHHILATYDGTSNANGVKLYVDGGTPFTATASSTGIRSVSSVEATIGAMSGGSALRLEGTLDEIAVWDSDQSANASTIYNGGVPNDLTSLSPLSWWRCGDGDTAPTLTDNGSGGNDGTMTNFSTFSTDVPIPFTNTKSILLDGVDDYVDVADNNNLSFGNGTTDSPFSISAWIKPTSAPFRIVFKWGTSTQEYYFQIAGGGKLQLILQDGVAYIGKNANTTISLNTWNHVLITYDGSSSANGINLYLNGNNDNFNNITSGTYTAMSNTTEPFLIGRYAGGSSSLGKIDEAAIFNSELSQSDVTSIYGGGNPSSLSSYSSLVSWWRFEGSGTTATDSGSGGNNGTLINGVTRSTDVPT